jgi:hypothetical protein
MTYVKIFKIWPLFHPVVGSVVGRRPVHMCNDKSPGPDRLPLPCSNFQPTQHWS